MGVKNFSPPTPTKDGIMKYDPAIHHRRSIRLRGYDYAWAGAYFITVCTQNRRCLFGDIAGGKMGLNDAGEMVVRWFFELNNKFPDIECDEFVCMPNHVHFIVVHPGTEKGEHAGSPVQVPAVVQWFKTMTTNAYIRGVKGHGWPPFPGKLWQRNYWDRIVRNEPELDRIREYIRTNPARWESDALNASRTG